MKQIVQPLDFSETLDNTIQLPWLERTTFGRYLSFIVELPCELGRGLHITIVSDETKVIL